MKNVSDILTHGGEEYGLYGSTNPPIFQTSLFPQSKNNDEENKYIYTRISNPTTEVAERKLALLEKGELALCFSSGMGAISSTILASVNKNSHVICIDTVYGPTRHFLNTYLKKFGVSTDFFDFSDLSKLEKIIQPNTTLIYLESPSSYVYNVQNLEKIARIAKKYQITTIVDNSYATPLCQNPLLFDIDFVVHSASKYLGGHSDIIGGVVVGSHNKITPLIEEERALFGSIMDPHQSWLLTRGLRTLEIRLPKHAENAQIVIAYLKKHPKIKKVYYPLDKTHSDYELAQQQLSGGNGLFSFIIDRELVDPHNFINKLNYFHIGPSWGGFESLASLITVDQELPGVPKDLIRLHIGLEDPETLIRDLELALE